jgi:hypothetical protein
VNQIDSSATSKRSKTYSSQRPHHGQVRHVVAGCQGHIVVLPSLPQLGVLDRKTRLNYRRSTLDYPKDLFRLTIADGETSEGDPILVAFRRSAPCSLRGPRAFTSGGRRRTRREEERKKIRRTGWNH